MKKFARALALMCAAAVTWVLGLALHGALRSKAKAKANAFEPANSRLARLARGRTIAPSTGTGTPTYPSQNESNLDLSSGCWRNLAPADIDDATKRFGTEHSTRSNLRHTGNVQRLCVSELSLSESCSSVGIAALILQTLEHVSLCERLGLEPVISWSQCVHCGPPSGVNHAAAFFDLTRNLATVADSDRKKVQEKRKTRRDDGGTSLLCLGDPTCFGIPFAEVEFGHGKDSLHIALDGQLRGKGERRCTTYTYIYERLDPTQLSFRVGIACTHPSTGC